MAATRTATGTQGAEDDDDGDEIEYSYNYDDDDEEEEEEQQHGGGMVLNGGGGGPTLPSASSSTPLASSSSRTSREGEDKEGGTAAGVGMVPVVRRSSSLGKGKQEQQYTILKLKCLEAKQARLVDELAERLSLGPLPAKMLLRRYGWNVRSVCDDHFDDAMAMIEATSKPRVTAAKKRGAGSMQTFNCGVCWDPCPVSDRMSLPGCTHAYCRPCLKGYFKARIDDGASKLLPCINPECHELYPEDMVLDVVDEADGAKYAKQNVEYFVNENPRIKFCPGPDCRLAAEIHDSSIKAPVSILCECGHRWCHSCMEPPHLPLPCDYYRQWKERTADDGEMATVEYIKLTSKLCPWCGHGVHRYQGCNFMLCRCGENWCFKCGGKVKRGTGHTWNTIEGHECGRLPAVDARRAGDVGRFMHYLSNFKSQRLMPEKSRREEGAEREELEDIALVNRCRKILANSYVFAYYAFEEGSPLASLLTLFEDKQQQLETTLEGFTRMMTADPAKRPPEQDFKTQRDLVKHWLKALYGTIEKDILGDGQYGIEIPKLQPELVVYDA